MMKQKKGFTLIEIVLSISIMAVIAVTLGIGLQKGFSAYQLLWSRRATLAQARMSMDRMVREIRLIENKLDINDITSSTSFDFDMQGTTNVVYDLNGTNLRRNTAAMASDVSALSFEYLDSDFVATTTSNDVRVIKLQFTITNPEGFWTYTLRSHVMLRGVGAYLNFAEL